MADGLPPRGEQTLAMVSSPSPKLATLRYVRVRVQTRLEYNTGKEKDFLWFPLDNRGRL